ncbi:unnamed protein product [Larinioides sclopetarius]|uniref:Uncharacterized protein n=1 Tax=Larinioides sclopetarius TaxID=280406 RepID=A0AAV1YTF3_9ARAC
MLLRRSKELKTNKSNILMNNLHLYLLLHCY